MTEDQDTTESEARKREIATLAIESEAEEAEDQARGWLLAGAKAKDIGRGRMIPPPSAADRSNTTAIDMILENGMRKWRAKRLSNAQTGPVDRKSVV